ncbi:MAG: tRNA 5-methoxyuridine(34)/uridine 5-oxyacetic acid(34) synthase CmoB [Methylococcaceae bacterium]|nr:tRNA 5-methoxyuridine(34)/uridine 5-oxyacetic acid(34) synthase CmoB [Methylococcaceae bacterium]
MIDLNGLHALLVDSGAEQWSLVLHQRIAQQLAELNHGDLPTWQKVVEELPMLEKSTLDLRDQVRIGEKQDVSEALRQSIRNELMKLHPWRKGPFSLFGIDLDTEWRSDWKWERLQNQITSLENRLVLDVGCGNGYHAWRMLGAGARAVIGIDPTLLSVLQFEAIKKLHGAAPIYVLPLAIEEFPLNNQLFDTVFSMGVLYHRRSPIDHLLELKSCLRPGGQLILETLVIEGDEHSLLMPEDRYAQMRNVWFLPSPELLMLWLRRCGFKSIQLVDVSKTTTQEQRSTEWMRFHSLQNYLDPDDQNLTCEGLPAPSRAIVIAEVE